MGGLIQFHVAENRVMEVCLRMRFFNFMWFIDDDDIEWLIGNRVSDSFTTIYLPVLENDSLENDGSKLEYKRQTLTDFKTMWEEQLVGKIEVLAKSSYSLHSSRNFFV